MKIIRPTLHVIGSGEAFGSDQGNTSYLLQGGNHPTVLFDCGYQIPERLWRDRSYRDISLICFTHLHADHSFGIVPLIARYAEEKRKKELTILGSKSCEGFIRRLIEMGYPGLQSRLAFKLRFQEISEQAEVRFRTLRIRAARTEHSILNHTLRIDFLKGEALSFAVSGDGRPTPSSLKLISDVAVLLHEAYSVKPSTPIHSSMMELEQMLTNTNIKNIGVSHHSRLELKKLQRRIRVLRRQDPRWFCVIPEMSIPLEGARSTIKF